MGYTFLIGNAVPEYSKDDGELSARWVVEGVVHPDAPTFPNDPVTGNSNSRSPSYSAWVDFCEEAGIYDLFYEERGQLRAGHPGCVMVTPSDLAKVREAREVWQKKATLPPGFAGKYDAVLARLIWLEWWMDWALKHCETPAIQNT